MREEFLPQVAEDELNVVPLLSDYEGDSDILKLKDLEFTDLFISEQGEAFFRGLEDSDSALSGVPEGAISDLDELHRKVCALGQNQAEFLLDYDTLRFRVSRIEDVNGIWYTLRRAKWPIPRLKDLGGINPRVIQALGYLGKRGKHGLIVIAGATGAGKTTTAGSLLLEYLNHYGDVAITIEDPIELSLSGAHGGGQCFQIPVENGDFATAMKRTMRRSPRYIFLGEVRSGMEADQAIRAAINGHLVITTVHAGSCIEAINAILKLCAGSPGGNLDLARSVLADGLAAVFHQQLLQVKGKSGRFLKLEYLFLGETAGPRTLIRNGKTEQLTTVIDAQASRVMNGKLPIGD